ncbi:uroporphyrinogen decarboxylase [Iris pallida]|uniref:Uroporphyrinogen decarboxylase n=1 Tax=Iris pallida TaxID=29817 RepID=A0AAX6EHZ3_IRIPA|nr:uroporphyrinogen decarboxylase [Iris pallida]
MLSVHSPKRTPWFLQTPLQFHHAPSSSRCGRVCCRTKSCESCGTPPTGCCERGESGETSSLAYEASREVHEGRVIKCFVKNILLFVKGLKMLIWLLKSLYSHVKFLSLMGLYYFLTSLPLFLG